eukprot:311817-Alexandrium_andersonii.AAC.1
MEPPRDAWCRARRERADATARRRRDQARVCLARLCQADSRSGRVMAGCGEPTRVSLGTGACLPPPSRANA